VKKEDKNDNNSKIDKGKEEFKEQGKNFNGRSEILQGFPGLLGSGDSGRRLRSVGDRNDLPGPAGSPHKWHLLECRTGRLLLGPSRL
jgi:hypothetical protein